MFFSSLFSLSYTLSRLIAKSFIEENWLGQNSIRFISIQMKLLSYRIICIHISNYSISLWCIFSLFYRLSNVTQIVGKEQKKFMFLRHIYLQRLKYERPKPDPLIFISEFVSIHTIHACHPHCNIGSNLSKEKKTC